MKAAALALRVVEGRNPRMEICDAVTRIAARFQI